jgi:hypothetical protein
VKHSEIYDKHQDRRKENRAKKKKHTDSDKWDRKSRVSFKNYVRDIRQTELEDDADDFDLDIHFKRR